MRDQETLEALYKTLQEKPNDQVTLLALADWYEEHDDTNAADCLRWTSRKRKHPFRYIPRKMKVKHSDWHSRWFWWARTRVGTDWGHPLSCRLPLKVWEALRHTFTYEPRVFKEYRTIREAYEALISVWPTVQRYL